MQEIQINALNISPAMLCNKCRGAMRLVGSEPHPVKDRTDLLTYACTVCEVFEVVPIPLAH